jgi:SAM-dependent methyltransferase
MTPADLTLFPYACSANVGQPDRKVKCRGILCVRDDLIVHCASCRAEYPVINGIPHLVWDDAPPSRYLSEAMVGVYHEMHYGAFVAPPRATPGRNGCGAAPSGEVDETVWSNLHHIHAPAEIFYARLADLLRPLMPTHGVAIDIGCGVGRTVAELSRLGARVTLGVDLSPRFVEEADRILLRADGHPLLKFNRRARATETVTAALPWKLSGAAVQFAVADAARLPVADAGVDVALLLNVVDRVHRPADVVAEAWRCLSPGGHLVLADPFDYQDGLTAIDERTYDLKHLLPEQEGATLCADTVIQFPVPYRWTQNVATYACQVIAVKKTLRSAPLAGPVITDDGSLPRALTEVA